MKKINRLIFILPFAIVACTAPKHPAAGNLQHLQSKHMSNISALHEAGKDLSVKALFKAQEGTVNSLQIKKGGMLEKHITKVPALLVCVDGEVIYETETGEKQTLFNGDFVLIKPMIVHWVKGHQDSQLILIK